MELWSEIRRRVLASEISLRQACSEYGLNFRTVRKIVRHPEPPPFRAPPPRRKPVLGPFLAVIQQIIDADRHAPPKQRHTVRRIYERLRDEHGYPGCPSIVRDAVRAYKQSQAEVFVPLLHPPGEGQVDFGRAEVRTALLGLHGAALLRRQTHASQSSAGLSKESAPTPVGHLAKSGSGLAKGKAR